MSTPIIKWSFLVAFMAALLALFLGFHSSSSQLLTPIPASSVTAPMFVSMAVAAALAYFASKDMASRLARRLTILAVMALSLYWSGEVFRGFYAKSAFAGPITSSNEEWMILPGQAGSTITIQNIERRKTLSLPAAPGVSSAGFGSCVTVPIERSEAGIERVAPTFKQIGTSSLTSC